MPSSGSSPSTTGIRHTGGSPPESSVPSHPPEPDRFRVAAQMYLALYAKLHLPQRASTPGEHRRSSTGWSDAKQTEALKRPEHLPGEGRHHRVLQGREIRKGGQKQVRPTNFGEMLLQEAGGEDKRAAQTTRGGGGWGKVPLPQHVVSCRGSQSGQVFSGFQAGMPQETAPHAPRDKRAVLCVNKHHCCAARQAVNQSYLIQFPPQSN